MRSTAVVAGRRARVARGVGALWLVGVIGAGCGGQPKPMDAGNGTPDAGSLADASADGGMPDASDAGSVMDASADGGVPDASDAGSVMDASADGGMPDTSDAGSVMDASADGGMAGCAGSCDDGDPCTDDCCQAGACTHTPNTAPCDDGDPCTSGDVCASGACGGTAYSCDDGDPCTDDMCAGDGSCSHTPIGSCAPTIVGYYFRLGTYGADGATGIYAQATTSWTGGMPTDETILFCTTGGTCNITGPADTTVARVDAGSAEAAFDIGAGYTFADPMAVHGVTFEFAATVGYAVSVIYPPVVPSGLRYYMSDGTNQAIPDASCTPSNEYYYNNVTTTITCTW